MQEGIYQESQLPDIAKEIFHQLGDTNTICLYGNLGAGKTTLTKALLAQLGIPTNKVKSPTYTYLRHYKTDEKEIYHLDLYRIEGEDELLNQELDDLFQKENTLFIIEWAERISKKLPSPRLEVFLEFVDPESRRIKTSLVH